MEIDPLSNDQIRAFLQAYLGAEAEGVLATIQRLELLEHARNPYQLSVLAACMSFRAVTCHPIGAASLPRMRTH